MKIAEKLLQLFPTIESLAEAKSKFPSWDAMARGIGLSKNSIYNHRKVLGMAIAKANAKKGTKSFADRLTTAEIDANIAKLIQGRSKNIVTCYKITNLEAFNKDVCGQEGLELIGTEHGSNWGQVSHKVSAIKGR
jgi:hypothetical protein